MTLHAAKGLEFPVVAMVGVEDGLIPHARAIGFATNPDELEEERRLAFVGITRAMKYLVLSYARYRTIRGISERTIASQFLQEMPEECFEEIDMTSDEGGIGSVGYRDEASYGRRSPQYNSAALEQHSTATAKGKEFHRGMLVRHPKFGLGRIETMTTTSSGTRAEIRFQSTGVKTPIILEFAAGTRGWLTFMVRYQAALTAKLSKYRR